MASLRNENHVYKVAGTEKLIKYGSFFSYFLSEILISKRISKKAYWLTL